MRKAILLLGILTIPLLLMACETTATVTPFVSPNPTVQAIGQDSFATRSALEVDLAQSAAQATRQAEAKVIDAQVRANLPTAIAFQTRTPVESRVILGCGGAEGLDRPGLALTFVKDEQGVGRWEKVQTLRVTPQAIQGLVGQSAVPRPPLSETEADLVLYALDYLEGAFVVNRLDEAFRGRVSRRRIVNLARQWEERGWLTAPAHATDARRVTPELEALARAAKAVTGSQAAQGDHRAPEWSQER